MIEIKNLKKSFRGTEVLKNINLNINKGEIVALIGPSGCGKTTTLKMINRLLRPSSGDILINGKSIYDMDAIMLRRNIGYVIQQTGLFPHMTVEENIELIPKSEKYPLDQIKNRTQELMEMIGIDRDFLNRYPGELSGGQQQRVGVARAFATDPDIILMDEPFSALDPISSVQLQDEVLKLQDKVRKTIVLVTHDMEEAIKLADRICIMKDGQVLQYDTPETILKNPQGSFVEDFVGKYRLWQSPELVRSEDVMIENPHSISPNSSLDRALEKMRIEKVDCLMVTERNTNKLLGIIRADMIQESLDKTQFVHTEMQSDFISCQRNQTLIDIIAILKENDLSSTPVTNEEGQLHGLITKGSLVLALSQPIIGDEGDQV